MNFRRILGSFLGFWVFLGVFWGFCDRTTQEKVYPGIDFEYLGAFRLPNETSNGTQWNGGGHGMCFYPLGDPSGAADGFSGSLFSISHVYQNYISEFTIPEPYISPAKDTNELPRAETIQPFVDVADGRQTGGLTGSTTGDIQYFPQQGNWECDKLVWTMYEYYMPPAEACYHGWCNLNFSNLNSVGLWRLGSFPSSRTSKYLFEIPAFWADQFVPGKILGAGRYRTQSGGSMGPCLYACAPWEDGNPPADGSSIDAIELIEYSDYGKPVKGYSFGDDWSDGAWLVEGKKSALVLTGNRGYRTSAGGTYIYGVPDPDDVGGKGYHSGPYYGAMLFYDPQIIAEVAKSNIAPSQVQPYAVFNVHNFLYDNVKCDLSTLAACGYDRDNQLFYVIEQDVEGFWRPRKPIVHVFRIQNSGLDPDTQAPSIPLNLTLIAANSNQVDLSWDASSDNYTSVTYCVFRNDRPVAFTEWTTFADDKVNPDGHYRYQVRAIDQSMNQSDFSATVNVTTPTGTDAQMPLIWNLAVAAADGTNIVLTWETDELANSHIGYHIIYQSPTYYASDETMTRNHQLNINGLVGDKTYSYYISSTDATGNSNKYASKTFRTDSYGNLRNNTPVLDGVGSQRAYAGEWIEIDLWADDVDTTDTLTFGVADAPVNATFNPTTGLFRWQTQMGDEGIHRVTFSVTDSRDTDTEEIALFVYSNTVSQCLLTLECRGQGCGVVSNRNTGTVCADVAQELIDEGTTVNLTAVPQTDSVFMYWMNDAGLTNAKYQIVITNHMTVHARFSYLDSDGDEIPDFWEQQHGGSTTALQPRDDLDGDGYDNLHEWIADTIPTNAASLPLMNQVDWQSDSFLLQWPASSNRLYQVYYSSNLLQTGSGFYMIADNIPGDPPQTRYTDTQHNTLTTGFYKIECRLPE